MFNFEFHLRSEEFLKLLGSLRLWSGIKFKYLVLGALVDRKWIEFRRVDASRRRPRDDR